ncbi:hypothetical protein RRG08_025108 [Elysia crispata]|uniref:Uncharacterized protein n=1 Tax=Elysia crispata TaxID=231223 RepID=A0AAE1E0I5_9GAST|nr:hypothetical protein RRG08_025108 [Elysia crispata]
MQQFGYVLRYNLVTLFSEIRGDIAALFDYSGRWRRQPLYFSDSRGRNIINFWHQAIATSLLASSRHFFESFPILVLFLQPFLIQIC